MNRSRRSFLRGALGSSTLLAMPASVPRFLARTAQAAAVSRGDRDTILVVVQLAGGNDGLNTVVPYEDDLYARSRPTLRLPSAELHKIDSQLGFHPRMSAFHRLYQEGNLSVLQGVGYPNPNGGHFESMHIWQTADPTSTKGETGWLGRTIDQVTRETPGSVPGVFVGKIAQPFTLNAARSIVPTIQGAQSGSSPGPAGGGLDISVLAETLAVPRPGGQGGFAEFLRQTAVEAVKNGREVTRAIESQDTGAYPPIQFAGMLRTVAQLIRADVGIRIFYTELGGKEPGGFDNHAGQADNHAALLHQLSESVAAFVEDLKRDGLLDRVLLLTFSEFGRTVRENGRRGTDHGSAAPLFLAGGRIRGGLVGEHPNLTDLENGGQKHHTDFRRVYATVLDEWLGFQSEPVLGGRFEAMEVLRG